MVPKGSMLRLKIKDKVLHPSLRETKAQHTQKRKDNAPAPKERPALPQDCGLTTTRYFPIWSGWPGQKNKQNTGNETEINYPQWDTIERKGLFTLVLHILYSTKYTRQPQALSSQKLGHTQHTTKHKTQGFLLVWKQEVGRAAGFDRSHFIASLISSSADGPPPPGTGSWTQTTESTNNATLRCEVHKQHTASWPGS